MGVWLDSLSEEKTAVRVDTAKSFVGFVGQEDWDEEIIGEMRISLSSGG